ncbi:MAG: hypothetical protein ACJAVV_001464 [Alphaproteobacteria bacterium]|jgi:hypothetical protein
MNRIYSNTQIAGIIIVFSSILSITLMTHHPTISANDISTQVTETISEVKLNKIVHGGLISLLILNFAAFTIYSISRGIQNLLVLIALLAYAMSTVMMTGAALINGFVFPSFLQDIAQDHQHLLEFTPLIKVFSWNINQTFASASVVATSCAISLWSLNLFHANLFQKLVAIMGLSVGIAITVLMLGGWLELDLMGMTAVVLVQSVWNMGIAYLLISKDIT